MIVLNNNNFNEDNKYHKKKIVIGIDLGTTYSVASYAQNKKMKIIYYHPHEYLIPSIVHYTKNNVVIGKEAKKMVVVNPVNTITSVKRLIGHSIQYIKKKYPYLPYKLKLNDGKNDVLICTEYAKVTPSHVSSEIIRYLLEQSTIILNNKIYGVVVTIPAYFNNIQRQKTKEAVQLSGIKLLRLLNEPTAAALAYGLNSIKNGIILVYDLGGGTFDVSILMLSNGIFEVLAINGNCSLGGDDFDDILVKYIADKLNLSYKNNYSFYRYLLKCANAAKIQLTQNNDTYIKIYKNILKITRTEFNTLLTPLIEKTIFLCQQTIQQANIKKHEINEIILVGGSTLIPFVKENVKKFFQRQPLDYINPKKVVAIGAGIHANILIGNNTLNKNQFILLDVLPCSLGIEVMGGLVEIIIPRNTTIPVSKKQFFTTFKNNQTAIIIHVLQGEEESVKNCKSLTRFILKGIPVKPAGKVYVCVTFQIDTDGILHVFAEEQSKKLKIQVTLEANQIFYDNS